MEIQTDMNRRKMTIFIVVVPYDYSSADLEFFESMEEAERYRDQLDPKLRHYATIREREILFPQQP